MRGSRKPAIVAVAVAAALAIAACSSSSSSSSSSGTSASSSSSSSAKVTLTWWNNGNTQPLLGVWQSVAAEFHASHPNVTINVNGYCDAIGGEEYNLKLSDRRADAVEDYLVNAGINESRLHPHGYGKTNFVATNDTAEGRAQNRRVELVPNE